MITKSSLWVRIALLLAVGCNGAEEAASSAPAPQAEAKIQAASPVGATLSVDEAYQNRFNAAARGIAASDKQLREDMRAGRWEQVLAQVDALDERAKAAGFPQQQYKLDAAEALLGLAKPREALQVLEKIKGDIGDRHRPGLLAKAMLGELDKETATSFAIEKLEYFPTLDEKALPGGNSRKSIEALVRLGRAIEFWSTGDPRAEREALEVLKLEPGQPVAGYMLAMDYLSQKRSAVELEPFFRIAVKLGGNHGKEAKKYLDNIESILAQQKKASP